MQCYGIQTRHRYGIVFQLHNVQTPTVISFILRFPILNVHPNTPIGYLCTIQKSDSQYCLSNIIST